MPVKRSSKRASKTSRKTVRKTSRKTSRKTMKGGAKRRTSKKSLKRSSKSSKGSSKRSQKGGRDGKIIVKEKDNHANFVELTKETIAKARPYYNNIDKLAVENVKRVLNLDGLINKFDSIEVEKIVVESVKWANAL